MRRQACRALSTISGAVFFDIEEIKDHRQEIGPDPCRSAKFGVRVARDIRQEIGPVDDADRGIAQGGEPFGRNESSSFASSD